MAGFDERATAAAERRPAGSGPDRQCGDHFVSERREVLRQFANGIGAAGRRAHRAFLDSVRVLRSQLWGGNSRSA
ncbi:hypothetical protein [Streptomyces flaveolus]|uniref:hypothetical protein n=1 Tax=Streptomyces flaveolus TaxID=67297 RepID=UPI0016716F76|nr:hypothetical protein [Streptomyces flaveolus]GGQ55718.1 hypothetical protein GCM10010216_16190 [Streptomyces flaveolus]